MILISIWWLQKLGKDWQYINKQHRSGGAVGRGTALHAGRSRLRFPIGSLGFFIDLIFPHCGPGVDSEISLGGKGGRCIGLRTLPLSCAVCLEILGVLSRLEPKGPVQVCTDIAYHFLCS